MALPSPKDSATALVTGASGGIGEAIARELASRGHGVTLVARREDRLRALAEELAGAHGVRAEPIAADLGPREERDRVASRIVELALDVEILINNAGFGGFGTVVELGADRQVDMVSLNCEALVDFQARYSPAMVDRGRGAILNVASTASFQPMPNNATYAATKAFVLSLSEASHTELAGAGVTVTALCPGPVHTEFGRIAGVGETQEKLPETFWVSAEAVAKAAVDGLARGKRVVIPGLVNRAGAVGGQHVPRMLLLPLVNRIGRGFL